MRFFTLVFFLLAPNLVRAQEAPLPLTVDEAVRQAVKNNPRLSAAVLDVSASQSGVRSARALANPSLVFAPGLTSSSGSGDEVLLSQPLELNGTRSARGGVANAQLRVTQAEAVVELRGLVSATKFAYYQLEQARELQALALEVLKNAQELDRVTRLLVEGGRRPGIDLAQTGIEVGRSQQQVTIADSNVTSAVAALNTLLGRPADTAVGPLSALSPSSDSIDESALVRQALRARAEIASATATRDTFLQEARLARAEGRPDLAPQIRFGSLVRGVPAADSGNGFGIGLSVNLPIFDYGSRRNRIRQAETSARAQSDRIIATQNLVQQEVIQAIARLRAAQRVAQSYQSGILDQSRRLLEGSRRAFQEGAAGTSILTILEAQRTYSAVQTDYINALATQAQSRAELERAAAGIPGTLLPTPRR